jgi:hypothetical protein
MHRPTGCCWCCHSIAWHGLLLRWIIHPNRRRVCVTYTTPSQLTCQPCTQCSTHVTLPLHVCCCCCCSLRTDQRSASTSTQGDVRAISQPSYGRSGARVVERSAALSQRRLTPAAPVINSTAEERPRFAGLEDDRPLGSWGELLLLYSNMFFRCWWFSSAVFCWCCYSQLSCG